MTDTQISGNSIELFDIHELIEKIERSGESDVKARTIHYYATKDLVKPIGFGRNSRYSMMHVYQYKLIRLLQKDQMSLEQIREELKKYSDANEVLAACERLQQRFTETLEQHDFSEERLWHKINDHVFHAGVKVVYSALILFYATTLQTLPAFKKTLLYSALAYFILPFDAVPDVLPGIGYTDDLGALTVAFMTCVTLIDSVVFIQARERLREWFPNTRSIVKDLEEVEAQIETFKS